MVLPRANRLRKSKEFATVYKRGTRHTTPHLTVQALQAQGLLADCQAPTRFGISVSQKVSKRAVVRNRIKRQIRAACRQLLPKILPGWSIVISARGLASECDYSQFLRELEQLLTKARVLNGH